MALSLVLLQAFKGLVANHVSSSENIQLQEILALIQALIQEFEKTNDDSLLALIGQLKNEYQPLNSVVFQNQILFEKLSAMDANLDTLSTPHAPSYVSSHGFFNSKPSLNDKHSDRNVKEKEQEEIDEDNLTHDGDLEMGKKGMQFN